MKKYLVIIFLAVGHYCVAQAPTPPYIKYSYDATGNRKKRQYVPVREDQDTTHSNIDGASISIYPNPTNGQFTLQVQSTEALEQSKAEVFDNAGRLVVSVAPLTETNNISIMNEKNGLYVMRVSINGKMQQWSLVKIE